MGIINDLLTTGGMNGFGIGGLTGCAVIYKMSDWTQKAVEKLNYNSLEKGNINSIWQKLLDYDDVLNKKGIAIAIGLGAFAALGCAYIGTKIGAKLDKQG